MDNCYESHLLRAFRGQAHLLAKLVVLLLLLLKQPHLHSKYGVVKHLGVGTGGDLGDIAKGVYFIGVSCSMIPQVDLRKRI
jgi:hypothetical protein